jgi:hypothetical protein
MNARTKLAWVDIPRQSLRQGLACGEGGVRIMLLMGEDRRLAEPTPGTAASRDPQPDARTADKPH